MMMNEGCDSTYSGQPEQNPVHPPLPPDNYPNWHYDGYTVHYNPDLPPISNLLIREADAWRAVLGLHGATVNATHRVARTPDNHAEAHLKFEEEGDTSNESREASYCSALTGLASQCDNLISEVLKLRSYRKSRRAMELGCFGEFARAHVDEILAVGTTLSTNGALNVSSATAELRAAIQNQRNQVTQLRLFLEAIKSTQALPLPKNGRLVIGVSVNDEKPVTEDLDKFMSTVFQDSRELNESTISNAIASLFGECKKKQTLPRQFVRRGCSVEVS